jgi:diguanylate cyclase (GGDEF)-like protein
LCHSAQEEYAAAVRELDALRDDKVRLGQENERLKSVLDHTVALYDITKRIAAFLDQQKVFNAFSEEVAKYLHVSACRLDKNVIADTTRADTVAVPIKIDTEHHGYLIAEGIDEEDKDTFRILTHQFVLGMRRALLYQKVQAMAITDGLTGVFSRRFFTERCQEELARSKKFRYDFAFLMVDLDHFKEFNDRYGHLVGDVLLREVARLIKEALRQIDLVGRYGGEEISILLPETDATGARFAAERIRQAVAATSIAAYDEHLQITISAGIAVYPQHGGHLEDLIEKADRALYEAKAAGRNCIRIYESKK